MESEHRTAVDTLSTTKATIDHIAHPSFDPRATHEFYTGVLGATLDGAWSGESATWNARYLMVAYSLRGVGLDFFTYEGIGRPLPDDLPRDIRHIGLALPTPEDCTAVRQRVEAAAAPHWVERRGDGEHLYVTDPNGLVIEFSVAEPRPDPRGDGASVLECWLSAH